MPMITTGHKVKIDMAPDFGTLVYLDGVLVKDLVCVEVRHHAHEVARVKLELLPSALEIVGEARVVERVEASPEDTRRVCEDAMLRAGGFGLATNESEGQ